MKLAVASWTHWNPETTVESLPETSEQLMDVFRDQRDTLLKESDWCVGTDTPLSPEVVEEWKQWRQLMRDITKTISFEDNQKWIEIPNPPVIGRPKTWINVDYDVLLERNAHVLEILNSGVEAGIFQPYPSDGGHHVH
jgi:hypothetical protein